MTFKLVNIWNPKGGQGKSMIAINLAAAAVEMGLKPLVICQDPQGTSSMIYEAGRLPFDVISAIPKSKPDANLVLIDHQASDWELPQGRLLLMPVKPARTQYKTYVDAKAIAEKAGKEIITVVTDAQHHRTEERETAKRLVEKGALEIPASGVFSRADAQLISIFDKEMNKAYKIKDRRNDFLKILGAILTDALEGNEGDKNVS
ncbi:chromosome partitioning protein [Bathymodiolus japonicus methanotrophic gill symbiont]|uniref:ParA family protein n=1 Tax=Bathymodiolus japonicus methanotrophic gill symbiont TaxID=113269 RepID=UPI001B4CC13C|nr:ParA family protein [Bathymodiolus japonicus methanotrophic gill symbiont]GFO73533.1 chromosome partitioning protein [Bathymodiolus japonicus methanotrophic gill symbiont]